jgi:hypothetical protein
MHIVGLPLIIAHRDRMLELLNANTMKYKKRQYKNSINNDLLRTLPFAMHLRVTEGSDSPLDWD